MVWSDTDNAQVYSSFPPTNGSAFSAKFCGVRRRDASTRSPLLLDRIPINLVHRHRPGDANPCAKDGFQVVCSPQAATFHSSFSANEYVPDSYHLVGTVVLSRLDYRNAVLAGLPAYLFRRLQSVMKAAARLIYGLRHSDALITLHWLWAQEKVRFKTAVLTGLLIELRRHT